MPTTPEQPRGIRRIPTSRGHRYTIDGKPAPGVTTLLGKGIPKPALPYWSARTVAEYVADLSSVDYHNLKTMGRDGLIRHLKGIPWDRRDKAAARGTEVHAIAEQLVHGAEVDVPEHLAGHVDAAIAFLNEWRVAPVLVEVVVASRQWHYCGTLDLICDLPDGRRALMDYKTTASGIYPETALQLAAYRHAEVYVGDDGTEMPMTEIGVDCAYAVWLRADGYDVIPVDTGPDVFKFFLHAAHIGRQLDDIGAWVHPAENWREHTTGNLTEKATA